MKFWLEVIGNAVMLFAMFLSILLLFAVAASYVIPAP